MGLVGCAMGAVVVDALGAGGDGVGAKTKVVSALPDRGPGVKALVGSEACDGAAARGSWVGAAGADASVVSVVGATPPLGLPVG